MLRSKFSRAERKENYRVRFFVIRNTLTDLMYKVAHQIEELSDLSLEEKMVWKCHGEKRTFFF